MARPAHEGPARELPQPIPCETPYLSLVIPVFNEAERIRDTLEQIARYLAQHCLSAELLVVDDGSTDGSTEAAMAAHVGEVAVTVLRHEKNVGKGYAVQQGVLLARGEVILICDADLSTPIDEITPLLHRMREGFDLVIASRALADSRIIVNQPRHRAFFGRLFNRFVRSWLVEDIVDTQCGFKLINREAAQTIFPRQRIAGFAFDVEILFLAQRFGFTIAEVPVRWHHVGPSHVRALQDGFRMVIDLVRIKWRWQRGGYGRRGCRIFHYGSTACREALSTNDEH